MASIKENTVDDDFVERKKRTDQNDLSTTPPKYYIFVRIPSQNSIIIISEKGDRKVIRGYLIGGIS
jgi:hypothetical protein